MAETAADHVVNGNQSMGDSAAPIDTPTESQPHNTAAVEVGDERGDQSAAQKPDVPTDPHVPVQSQPQNVQEQAQLDQAPSNGSSLLGPDNTISMSDTPSNEPSYPATFPEPSPLSGEPGDLEWRRSSQSQDTFGRAERSNSFKKPTSFKSVSVTKNFLAKSTTGAPATKSTTEKTSSPSPISFSSSAAAKPRLVAKSVRDARSTPLSTTGASPGPDASKVWNRNRPAPPAPPKQFTDEELKQQYGIHLATRLQSDEPNKGSKWADMEDDEDDWAPDTVEWMDGTKTTAQQPENQQPMAPEPKLSPPQPEEDPEKAEVDSKHEASSLGPGKTILRPGARASQSITRPGLVLKSVPENQSPVPQPTTSTNSKSPWAKLPPVEKVSPVTFQLPAVPPGQAPSHLRRDSSAAASAVGSAIDSNLPTPAREIAADTFDRSWRSYERGSRELFDAKSGKYEPARGGRRASFRQDGGFRPPSLLQRPSQYEHERGYGSQDVRSFDKRRGSSNAKEGSGFERRTSTFEHEPPSDRGTSPQVARSDTSAQEPAIPVSSHVDSNASHRPYAAHGTDGTVTSPNADGQTPDVQAQQELMRQRIEANRRRKQEEQEQEYLARKERIRQKMAALDASSPKQQRDEKIEGAGQTANDLSPAKPHETPATRATPSIHDDHRIVSETPTGATVVGAASPSKSEEQPHLDGLGEVPRAAYAGSGLHQPFARPATHINPAASLGPTAQPAQFPPSNSKFSNSPRPSSQALPQTSTHLSQPHSNSAVQAHSQLHRTSDQSHLLSSDTRTLSHTPSPASFERSQHHWSSNQPPSLSSSSWSHQSGPPASYGQANVWGPPTNDKALGNGSFNPDFHRPPYPYPSHHLRHSPQPPGPIAPPSVSPRPYNSSRPDLQEKSQGKTMASPVCVASPSTSTFHDPPSSNTGKQVASSASAAPAKQPAFHNNIAGFNPGAYGKGSYTGAPVSLKTRAQAQQLENREKAAAVGRHWLMDKDNIQTVEKMQAQKEKEKRDQERIAGKPIEPKRTAVQGVQKLTGRGEDRDSNVATIDLIPGAQKPTSATASTAAPATQPVNEASIASATTSIAAAATNTATLSPFERMVANVIENVQLENRPSDDVQALFFNHPQLMYSVRDILWKEGAKINISNELMAKKTYRCPNGEVMQVHLYTTPKADTFPSNTLLGPQPQRPGYNGATPLVKSQGWNERGAGLNNTEILLGKINEYRTPQKPKEPQAAAAPLTATKSSFDVSLTIPANTATEVLTPGQQPFAGSKNEDNLQSKSRDSSVFPGPENGSRPDVSAPSVSPMVFGSINDSTLKMKRAASPEVTTTSPSPKPAALATSKDAAAMAQATQAVLNKKGHKSNLTANATPISLPTTTNIQHTIGSAGRDWNDEWDSTAWKNGVNVQDWNALPDSLLSDPEPVVAQSIPEAGITQSTPISTSTAANSSLQPDNTRIISTSLVLEPSAARSVPSANYGLKRSPKPVLSESAQTTTPQAAQKPASVQTAPKTSGAPSSKPAPVSAQNTTKAPSVQSASKPVTAPTSTNSVNKSQANSKAAAPSASSQQSATKPTAQPSAGKPAQSLRQAGQTYYNDNGDKVVLEKQPFEPNDNDHRNPHWGVVNSVRGHGSGYRGVNYRGRLNQPRGGWA